jgi:hypothetical protein
MRLESGCSSTMMLVVVIIRLAGCTSVMMVALKRLDALLTRQPSRSSLDITVKLADTPALGHFLLHPPTVWPLTVHTDSLLALSSTAIPDIDSIKTTLAYDDNYTNHSPEMDYRNPLSIPCSEHIPGYQIVPSTRPSHLRTSEILCLTVQPSICRGT